MATGQLPEVGEGFLDALSPGEWQTLEAALDGLWEGRLLFPSEEVLLMRAEFAARQASFEEGGGPGEDEEGG